MAFIWRFDGVYMAFGYKGVWMEFIWRLDINAFGWNHKKNNKGKKLIKYS